MSGKLIYKYRLTLELHNNKVFFIKAVYLKKVINNHFFYTLHTATINYIKYPFIRINMLHTPRVPTYF